MTFCTRQNHLLIVTGQFVHKKLTIFFFFYKTLQTLKGDPTIKICSFNKGNGVVIVYSEVDFEKMDEIV